MININLIVFIILFILFLFFVSNHLIFYIFLNKYKNVIEIFDYFCIKSFNIIYQDQIVGYSSNGQTNIPNDEYETIQRNFIKMTFNTMGQKNIKMFIKFFGSNDVFVTNLILFFRDKVTNDLLAKIVNQETLQEKN